MAACLITPIAAYEPATLKSTAQSSAECVICRQKLRHCHCRRRKMRKMRILREAACFWSFFAVTSPFPSIQCWRLEHPIKIAMPTDWLLWMTDLYQGLLWFFETPCLVSYNTVKEALSCMETKHQACFHGCSGSWSHCAVLLSISLAVVSALPNSFGFALHWWWCWTSKRLYTTSCAHFGPKHLYHCLCFLLGFIHQDVLLAEKELLAWRYGFKIMQPLILH